MSTLKICTHSRTHWITGVREVELLHSFGFKYPSFPEPTTKEENRGQQRTIDEALMAAAFSGSVEVPPHGVRLTDFFGDPTEIGHALLVKREMGDATTWIVPARACFLMSPSGQTIDRF